MSPDLKVAFEAIVNALERSRTRLANAPQHSTETSQRYAEGKHDPRSAAMAYQAGQLEQICRNESAALECHIKHLRAAAGLDEVSK